MEDFPKILYHYTTINTFYNMMEHSLRYEKDDIHPQYINMWATHYAYQNDPTECQLFFEGLQKGVLDYTEKNNIKLDDKSKELIQRPWYGLNIFTISFSEQEDDLTMWRGYGQNGDGVCLGFDFSKVPSTLPITGTKSDERKYTSESAPAYLLSKNIRKCEYIDINNKNIAEEACKKTVANILDEDHKWTDVKQLMIFNEYAPIYKHYKYEVEGEWRIIKNNNMPKYRIGEGKTLIPYLEISVPVECLKKITIGPCQTSKEDNI